ncbi:MAG: PIN domain-containing protein [Pseudomonadota bacterium]
MGAQGTATPGDAGTAPGPERWFLDACVLVPLLPRRVLAEAGAAGLIRPAWSARVLEEWRIAAARRGGAARGMAAEGEARAAAEALAAAHPDGAVAPDPGLEAALAAILPDRADAHVAAAAAAAEAPVITFNIRDFPARRLVPHGIEARQADAALAALHDEAPGPMDGVVAAALAGLDQAPDPGDRAAGRRALKRAGLPRLGKAWAGA